MGGTQEGGDLSRAIKFRLSPEPLVGLPGGHALRWSCGWEFAEGETSLHVTNGVYGRGKEGSVLVLFAGRGFQSLE